MNKKWKAHYNAAQSFGKISCCIGKVRHPTYSSAQQMVNLTLVKYGKIKSPYPCPFCNGWHVGRELTKKELRKYS